MNYILTIIGNSRKYASKIPVKEKTAEEIIKAFNKSYSKEVHQRNYIQIRSCHLLVKTLNLYLESMEYIGFQQKMRQKHRWLSDLIELLN